ncbi:MAG: lysoplasmalogenase family protein [Phyllobacterium sp.]
MNLPFPGELSDPLNGTLFLSVLAALLYTQMIEREASWRRTAAKALAVGLLAVLAFRAGGPVLLVAALALSALGDALLAQEKDRWFMGGLAAFLLAHVAYIALFLTAPAASFLAEPWRLALLAGLAGFGLFMGRRLMAGVPADMRMPVLAYLVVILGMVAVAIGNQPVLIVLGAALFAASDTILALEKFLMGADSEYRRPAKYAVWLLYYLAQATITLAILL